MSKIVELFPKSPAKVEVEALKEEVLFNPSQAWAEFLSASHRYPVSAASILQHEVTVFDLVRAIALARCITKSVPAENYFVTILLALPREEFTIPLSSVEERFRGYVWSHDWANFAKVHAALEFHLGDIIHKAITRHIFRL
jgi:hypothetical protein